MTLHPRNRAERVYARLLRLFSPSFRDRFGPDLLELFRDKHRAAAARGFFPLVWFWIRITADAIGSAAQQRESLMEGVLQDVRYAWRLMLRRPGLSLVIILTLGLGIGANTAIFSLVNTVLLGGEPYPEADRLVTIREQHVQRGRSPVRPGNFFDWKARTTSFEDVAWSRDIIFNLTGDGEPESIIGYRFSPNMFNVLGMQAALGRTFTEDEDKPGAPRVVVLSDMLWQRRYARDHGILGRAITLNGASYTVIGVMPPAFKHPRRSELWTPIALSPELAASRETSVLRLIGRLKPGVTPEQAQAEVAGIYEDLARLHPATNTGMSVQMLPFGGPGDAKPLLLVLFAGVGFVLLIACANVANLLLADATARRRELAMRSALGASRYRVMRQMLTESVMMALAGGALGALLTWWAREALVKAFPSNIANLSLPLVERIDVDATVFLFALVVSVVTGLLFGMLPAWNVSRASLQGALKDGDRGSASRRTHSVLVVSEVALSIVLLAGALLMVQSFRHLQREQLGFVPDRVLSARAILPQYRYPNAASRVAFTRDVVARLRAIPGVESAGATNYLPLSGWSSVIDFQIEGRPAPLPGQELEAGFETPTEDYFQAMGMRVLNGRAFTARDDTSAPRVVIVNETLARLHWPGENPVGRRLLMRTSSGVAPYEIVGVVADVRTDGLEAPVTPTLSFSYWQSPDANIGFALRTRLDPASLASQVRAAVWAVDRDQPVTYMMPMSDLASESLAFRRAGMSLAAGFGLLALGLAAMGIYGVLSYSVSRRAREIGVRMALGATRAGVARAVLREGLTMTGVGIVIGVAAALLLTRFLAGVLYGVQPRDPWTLAAVAGVLLVIAVLATLIPARRATSVDPIVALRAQ